MTTNYNPFEEAEKNSQKISLEQLQDEFSTKFEIIEELKAGGMGRVFEAIDLNIQRKSVIKILKDEFSEDSDLVKQFDQEITILGKINHRNVVAIHQAGETPSGLRYFVMELVEGESLQDRIDQGGEFSTEEICHVVGSTCDGLEALHKAGIIHGDIKPANILIGTNYEVKVVDAGIAVFLGGATTAGSGNYMSPEQHLREKLDPRSDIWSLGKTMKCLLEKSDGFSSPDLKEVAEIATRKERSSRFPSIRAMKAALTQQSLTPTVEVGLSCIRIGDSVIERGTTVNVLIEEFGAESSRSQTRSMYDSEEFTKLTWAETGVSCEFDRENKIKLLEIPFLGENKYPGQVAFASGVPLEAANAEVWRNFGFRKEVLPALAIRLTNRPYDRLHSIREKNPLWYRFSNAARQDRQLREEFLVAFEECRRLRMDVSPTKEVLVVWPREEPQRYIDETTTGSITITRNTLEGQGEAINLSNIESISLNHADRRGRTAGYVVAALFLAGLGLSGIELLLKKLPGAATLPENVGGAIWIGVACLACFALHRYDSINGSDGVLEVKGIKGSWRFNGSYQILKAIEKEVKKRMR